MKYSVLASVRVMPVDELADIALRMAEAHPETFEALVGVRSNDFTFDVPNTSPLIRVSFTAQQLNELKAQAPTNKLGAIKRVREITQIGLKEAKDFVEIVLLKQ
jgi:ribosomal protein L7/L12